MIGGIPLLDIEIYQTRADVYFQLRGRIVLEECERLRTTCLPLINKGIDQVIVDLGKVEFIDSAGLGVLVGFKMAASKNKSRIVLLQPSKAVSDILYISKLDGIFDIITGAEGDLLKSQIMQPQFKHGAGQFLDKSIDRLPAAAPMPSLDINQSRFDTAYPEEGVVGRAEVPDTSPTLRAQRELIEEHCRKAVEYMRQGNYDGSVDEYKNALNIDPDYLPALNNLAIVYEKQPSWISKAIEQWEHVLSISQQRGDQKHIDRAQRHLANLRKMSV